MRAQLRTRGIPYVVVDLTGELLHDTPSIGATNWNGGLTATRHLLSLGHRRIGGDRRPGLDPVQPRAGSTATARRWTRPACRSTRTLDQPRQVPRRGGHRPRARARSRLPTGRPRSSPATTSRRSASTRPRARRGSTSPEDLSVVGFDDLPVAQRVPLADDDDRASRSSTWRRAAAEMVIAIARGEPPAQFPRVRAGRGGADHSRERLRRRRAVVAGCPRSPAR